MMHLVNRLTFDLLCPGEEQAFDMRRQVSSMMVQEQVQEMIDRVCSQYAGEEQWITIEQLEVDLGAFSPSSFSTAFAGSFLEKLEKELREKLSKAISGPATPSRRLSEMELLQYFLQHGVLPWWGSAMEPDTDAICAESIRHQAGDFTRFLLQHRFDRPLWRRISYQLNSTSRGQIIELLSPLSAAATSIQQWLARSYAGAFPGQPSPGDTIQSTVQKIVLENAPQLFQNKEPLDIPAAISRRAAGISSPAETGLLNSLLLSGDAAAAVPLLNANAMPAAGAAGHQPAEEPEKFFIKTAGIVLLTPFFQPFFTELGLLDGGEWINKTAAYRGVHLLVLLGRGLQHQPEYGMALEKICCSLSPDEPVPIEVELDEKEIAEADSLLTAVIGHWTALKKTSVAGLRESFFKRDGILTRRGNDWLLQVERKTLDVLVDRIPWVYNPVRLPWNNYRIMVEW